MANATLKITAQRNLMSAMQIAFTTERENENHPDVLAEMDKQMRRVEKLFGYEVGSWPRGT